jgi:hypothetical protein
VGRLIARCFDRMLLCALLAVFPIVDHFYFDLVSGGYRVILALDDLLKLAVFVSVELKVSVNLLESRCHLLLSLAHQLLFSLYYPYVF